MKEKAFRTNSCPKCQGVSFLISPTEDIPLEKAVYGCKACGHLFDYKFRAFIKSNEKVKDVFKGVSLAKELVDSTTPPDLSDTAKTVLMASMINYGINMWYDGLKQGLLISVIESEAKKDKSNDGQDSN